MTPAEEQKHYAITQHALCCKYLDVAEPYDGEGDTLSEAVTALKKDRDEWKDESALRSKETEVWKHETKIVREELEATRKEAIDLFIAYHEAKESLRVALNWIADSHDDQEGRDLIVEPFRAKHFPTKADLGLDSENDELSRGDSAPNA